MIWTKTIRDQIYEEGFNEGYQKGLKAERHGYWTYTYCSKWKCSNCNEISNSYFRYCPNCGTRMNGGED